MNTITLCKYLVGNKQAILQIGETRRVLWLGLLFVLSAGFAREYDGEDLLHEPWHLAIPLGASVVSSFLLYVLIWWVADSRKAKNPFWKGYAIFLALYWMTAPLAWLYAIPVERFLSAADSVRANLWLLGIVSVWRVALITRVVSVIYRCKPIAAFFVVMLFADALAQAALSFVPLPIISVMGGIRLTEAESIILGTTFFVRFFGIVSFPIWLIATIVVANCTSQANDWQTRPFSTGAHRVGRSLWALAFVAFAVWPFVLPLTQVEQVNRRLVDGQLKSSDIAGALAYMSEREIDDFPPHWDPPPRIGYGEAEPDIFDVLKIINRDNPVSWVRTKFVQKILLQSEAEFYAQRRVIDLAQMSEEDLATYVDLLGSVGTGPHIAASHESEIERIIRNADRPGEEHGTPITESRRELLQKILAMISTNKQSEDKP